MEQYKDLAIIVTRNQACESREALLFEILNNLEAKHLILQDTAEQLELDYEIVKAEQESFLLRAIELEDKAMVAQTRVKALKWIAAGGAVLSAMLGATIGIVITR